MSAIYAGSTTHTRHKPALNRFKYGLYMLYIDLVEAQSGALECWPLFSTKTRYSFLSYLPEDHMITEPSGHPYKTVCDVVERETGHRPTGPIRLLTNPRIFGIEFNPVSFYYVFEQDDTTLQCVVAEVGNFPWFEQHNYVVAPISKTSFRATQKSFHVSPFIQLQDIEYDWEICPPDEQLRVRIRLSKNREHFFIASLNARKLPWTYFNILLMQFRYPLHTVRVMTGILFEAAKLYRKGLTFFPHPEGTETRLSRFVELTVRAIYFVRDRLRYSFERLTRFHRRRRPT